MELAASRVAPARPLAAVLRIDRRSLGAWLLGLAPVLYLALRGGGYDLLVRSQVGLAAWWIVLLGVVAGALPLSRISRLGWAAIALFAGFVIWTGIAATWSESAEQTMAEFGRVAGYLGFLVVGLVSVRRDTLRALINGLAAAFGVVALLAVLSRLYPSAFPADQLTGFFGRSSRLDYPFNYSDGNGEFIAIGIPLLLLVATSARTIAGQALAAAALPISVVGLVLTASRGGVLAFFVGVLAFYAFAPSRLPKVATGVLAGGGGAILVAGLLHRDALRHNLVGPAGVSQRHQLALLMLFTCAGVALGQAAIALTVRYGVRGRAVRVNRRFASTASLTALVIGIVVAIAVGVPGKLSHEWSVFKQVNQTASGDIYSRLTNVAGSHRYQYWQAAAHALETKPLTGIGPGTFQFYWAQHGSIYEHVLNAHSLYMETLAEAGVVGLALLLGLFLSVLIGGIWRALRSPPLTRTLLAGATAAFAAFCIAAAFDWVWQLAAIPVAALLLAAGILGSGDARDVARPTAETWTIRVGAALAALAAIVAIALPMALTSAIRSSQSEVRAGHLQAALGDAATAQRLEPYAASPRLQRALILEQLGDLGGARIAIGQAAVREPTNWQIWLIRARIEAESGNARVAVGYYRRAHALNPLSPTTTLSG